jgi:glycosyltransferase involved in cell wall biosynthesis
MRNGITLVARNQFGYQTDYFNFSKILTQKFGRESVTSLCLDAGFEKIPPENAVVVYVAGQSHSKLFRFASLLKASLSALKLGDTLVVKYFPGASLLRFSRCRKNLVIDIRTLSVSPNILKRTLQDLLCRIEIMGHRRIAVVSEQVANKLKLNNWHLLPLGANPPFLNRKDRQPPGNETPIFVYAGTLDGRDLITMLDGFQIASLRMDVKLRIIGDGTSRPRLLAHCEELKIEDRVEFFGHIPHGEQFSSLLTSSTFGIVHVPPTDYYACQPSTKMYEYWAHGLPVLCSNYPAGASDVEFGTGSVYEFNPSDLADCILESCRNIEAFSFSKIQELANKHTWYSVVQSHLVPLLSNNSRTNA